MEAFVSVMAGKPTRFACHQLCHRQPEARRLIDSKSLFGSGHMSDDWWHKADAHPLMTIGNHGWDHNHPDLEEGHYARGGFEMVAILNIVISRWFRPVNSSRENRSQPCFFAYPFGESSEYIRNEYFPFHETSTIAWPPLEPTPAWLLLKVTVGICHALFAAGTGLHRQNCWQTWVYNCMCLGDGNSQSTMKWRFRANASPDPAIRVLHFAGIRPCGHRNHNECECLECLFVI